MDWPTRRPGDPAWLRPPCCAAACFVSALATAAVRLTCLAVAMQREVKWHVDLTRGPSPSSRPERTLAEKLAGTLTVLVRLVVHCCLHGVGAMQSPAELGHPY